MTQPPFFQSRFRRGNGPVFRVADTGYRAFPGPTRVIASDATFTDRVAIACSPPAELALQSIRSGAIWSTTPHRTSSVATVSLTTVDETTAVPGSKYYYWVAASNSTNPGFFSLPDTGSCGPVPDSALYACGVNQYGQIGSGDYTPTWFNEPAPLVEGTGVMTMYCGSFPRSRSEQRNLMGLRSQHVGPVGKRCHNENAGADSGSGTDLCRQCRSGSSPYRRGELQWHRLGLGQRTQGQLGVNAFTEYHAPVQSSTSPMLQR